jgi:hypothetical protein
MTIPYKLLFQSEIKLISTIRSSITLDVLRVSVLLYVTHWFIDFKKNVADVFKPEDSTWTISYCSN